MKGFVSDPSRNYSKPGPSAEETLRVIATLPVPPGVEQRVQRRLSAAPQGARVLLWPGSGVAAVNWTGSWIRGAAAAAIVVVVAGGGWGIYSHVQTPVAVRESLTAAHGGMTTGFSSAGAMRTPQTLPAPVVTHAHRPETAAVKKAPAGKGTHALVRPAKSAGGPATQQ